jgi:uncharacterized membrane protein YeaQ/YmgE (transglycosylase-associated protein family)
MPEFTLDVYGKEYVIDAPDQKSAVDAAMGHYKSTYGETAQQPVAPQVPIESGTLLTTPLEGGGRPAPEIQGPPVLPEAMAQPGLPQAGLPMQPQQMPPVEQVPLAGSIDTVQRAVSGDSNAIAAVALGSAMAGQEREQNLAAAALRGVAPTSAGAAGGALLGGLISRSPAGAAIGARVGPAAMEGANLLVSGFNKLFGTSVSTPDEVVQQLLTQYGVPESVTASEQSMEAGAKGLASSMSGTAFGRQLAMSAAPKVAKVGQFLAANPVAQAVGGTVGALASEEARQQGAGMGGQITAGLVGAVVPGAALSGVKAVGSAVKQFFTPSGHITKALQQAGGRVPILKTKALQEIAQAYAADPNTLQAAKTLGLDVENMSPAMLSKNPQAQSIYFGVQSARGSQTGMQVAADVQALKDKALDLAQKWGAKDLSELNAEMRNSMKSTVDDLQAAANKIYNEELPKLIPARTPVPNGEAVAFAKKRLADFGGDFEQLTSLDKKILSLAGKPVLSAIPEDIKRQASFLSARNGTTFSEELAKMDIPKSAAEPKNYFTYDETRKLVGAKTRGETVFSDADKGLAKEYYKRLTKDQNAVAEALGHRDLVDEAKALVQQRKDLEDQMIDLFGKQLDKSFVTKGMRPALSVIGKADSDKLVNLINAIPKEFREDVIVSGITSMFSRANSDGTFNPKLFSNFMSGLEKNSVAKTAIFSNIPAETRKELDALAMLSKNYVKGLEERIGTGALAEALKESAPLLQKVANYVLTYKGGLLGLFGTHFLNAKAAPLQAADDLLSSGPFLEMVKISKADPNKFAPAARKVTSSPAFVKFANAANIPAAARATFFTLDQEQPQQESK